MHTEVHNAVMAADQGTQYDESAKRLLGQKSILAQILVRMVDEFKGMNPRYVETLIEGEPYISRIPLEPGLTNQEVMKAAVKSPNQVLFLTGVFPSGKRGYFAVDLTQE